jgi:nucleoside-diphosphate-sugar epimerase
VLTSGTALAAAGRIATEDDGSNPAVSPRARTEDIVIDAARHGVRGSVVRLPPTVHGRGDHGFVPMLIRTAREKGFAAWIGDGGNRWPAVRRADAARLFRLALERAPAGTRLHAVAEEGIAFRTIAEAIGTGLDLPARGIGADAAAAHFGWMARFAAIDGPTSGAQTRAAFGWQPQGPGLLADMRASGYFGNS